MNIYNQVHTEKIIDILKQKAKISIKKVSQRGIQQKR